MRRQVIISNTGHSRKAEYGHLILDVDSVRAANQGADPPGWREVTLLLYDGVAPEDLNADWTLHWRVYSGRQPDDPWFLAAIKGGGAEPWAEKMRRLDADLLTSWRGNPIAPCVVLPDWDSYLQLQTSPKPPAPKKGFRLGNQLRITDIQYQTLKLVERGYTHSDVAAAMGRHKLTTYGHFKGLVEKGVLSQGRPGVARSNKILIPPRDLLLPGEVPLPDCCRLPLPRSVARETTRTGSGHSVLADALEEAGVEEPYYLHVLRSDNPGHKPARDRLVERIA